MTDCHESLHNASVYLRTCARARPGVQRERCYDRPRESSAGRASEWPTRSPLLAAWGIRPGSMSEDALLGPLSYGAPSDESTSNQTINTRRPGQATLKQ